MRGVGIEGSLASERDFYRRLLDLGGQEEIEPLLDQALALIVEVTGAKSAYLELYDNHGGEPRYWKGHGCSDEDVEAIRARLTELGKPFEIVVYPGAGHAFFNDARTQFHAGSAKDAWPRTLEWFERHLA